MTEDKTVSHQQVKQIAKEALIIERYLLRRAWGLCYAVIAAQIGLIISFDILFRSLKLSSDYALIVPLAFNTSVSIFGAAVAIWVFKKAYNAMLVRREIVDSEWTKLFRPLWVAALWLIYYLPILLAIIFLRPIAGAVLFGVLAAATGPFYFSLKVSFPERLPREGIAVLATFAFCALGNLTYFLLSGTIAPLFWVLMIAAAIAAAAYVYRQKPPKPPEEQPD